MPQAADASTTIVMVPRERYGLTRKSLESLFAHTPGGFALVVVTSAAPADLRAWLDGEAAARGFTHLAEPAQIAPNAARNRGAALARTRYIAFVDNDVMFTPGWLEHLVACAEETGAAVVTPLTCHGTPLHTIVHHAGGEFAPDPAAWFASPRGERQITEVMHAQGLKVADRTWARGPTQCCEFHCALVRRASFEAVGGLDEAMLATKEHLDFCMSVIEHGASVMFEPNSIVTYQFPNRDAPIEAADWPFFLVRWSPEWQRRSLEHFGAKWGLKDEGYLEKRAKKVFWRHYEGVVKPQLRAMPLAQAPVIGPLVAKLIWWRTRLHAMALTARADRARKPRAARAAA